MSPPSSTASRIVRSAAPVRICDNGGWSDTWFARYGCVFNLAVSPCVEVEVRWTPAATVTTAAAETVRAAGEPGTGGAAGASGTGEAAGAAGAADDRGASTRAIAEDRTWTLTIHAENFGPPYVRNPRRAGWDQQPLIEAAIDAALEGLPLALASGSGRGDAAALDRDTAGAACHVCVHSDAPPGASVGSSASTAVAVLGAMGRFVGRAWDATTIAAAAHRVETERLGRQSGIQDQLAAACGGASFIEMDAYPHARVTALPLDADLRWELDARLSLVYLGRAHESSAIHDRVIADLTDRGPDAPPLEALRRAARDARDALVVRDLPALGRAFQDNTDAQASLHPDLIGAAARRVIEIARAHGALGWKVNGAGGDGGSIAILGGPSQPATRTMRRALAADNPSFQLIPVRISTNGLRVWETR